MIVEERVAFTACFHKKKVYKKVGFKWPESSENRRKITRLNFQNYVFLLDKNQHYVIIAFKMLKMELNSSVEGKQRKGNSF